MGFSTLQSAFYSYMQAETLAKASHCDRVTPINGSKSYRLQ